MRIPSQTHTSATIFTQENKVKFVADSGSEMWLAYIDYIDEIIVDSFFQIIRCSLHFLLDNTSPSSDLEPLFETVMELQVPHALSSSLVQFCPIYFTIPILHLLSAIVILLLVQPKKFYLD